MNSCCFNWKALLNILLCNCFLLLQFSAKLYGGIHSLPVIIPAQMIRVVQYHPIEMYRLFICDSDGTAKPIPFQIDEKDRYGDYILNEGPLPNTKFSNDILDFRDELSVMGNDIGPVKVPTKWPFKKPSVLYEVKFKNRKTNEEGAIYVGAYFSSPPALSPASYVSYDKKKAEILTSRYRYKFNPLNYLIVQGVNIIKDKGKVEVPIIESSSLFLKADLKYFLTFSVNQESVESDLEAYKSGPIRYISRVNFNYKILKLNFDLGMYTELSFFSNSFLLPALIDNPMDGKKILNRGSQFYYGFAFIDNPWTLKIDTNMPEYQESTIIDFLKGHKKVENHYWFYASSNDYMIYVEMDPSVQMQASGNVPMFYKENTPAVNLVSRAKGAAPLGESPVNFAIAVDLTAFSAGLHNVAIRLYVENHNSNKVIEEYKSVDDWQISANRLSSSAF